VALVVAMAFAVVAMVPMGMMGMGMIVAALRLLAGSAHECGKELGITHGLPPISIVRVISYDTYLTIYLR
jgi:hypothetical protein